MTAFLLTFWIRLWQIRSSIKFFHLSALHFFARNSCSNQSVLWQHLASFSSGWCIQSPVKSHSQHLNNIWVSFQNQFESAKSYKLSTNGSFHVYISCVSVSAAKGWAYTNYTNWNKISHFDPGMTRVIFYTGSYTSRAGLNKLYIQNYAGGKKNSNCGHNKVKIMPSKPRNKQTTIEISQ